MAWSRRRFVQSSAAAATLLLSARGREAQAFGGHRDAPPDAGGGLIRLDSNENPAGPCPVAAEAIREATRLSHVYPFRFTDALDGILARHDVRADQVLAGCGSSEVLLNAVLAFTDAKRGLVAPTPTFEEPVRRARALGRPVHEVPVRPKDLQVDLDGLLAKIDGAGLVFLCNPNNPTSVALPYDDIQAFVREALRRAPDVVILLDEAYIEYATGAVRSALPLALESPRVVVSRTFSKMYGLAGLRIGYALGQPAALGRMADYSLPMAINTIALHAVRAALADRGFEDRERARNAEARAYTVRRLEALGLTVAPSHANFVMADVKRDTVAFRNACRTQGIAVGRPFPPLQTWSRISIGTIDEMQHACGVFEAVLKA